MRKPRWLIAFVLAVAFMPVRSMAQERVTISGQVTDAETQRPLPGAQVTVSAARVGMTTDANGRFQFNVPRGTHTVRVTYIGYKQVTREVNANAPATVNFALENDPLRLDELVVTGYTQERRRFVTGAISSVKPEAVKEIPATQIQEVLRGRTPGVQVVQNSGTPGSALTVRVRGSSSVSGGNDPLYVIDGVPLIQGNASRLGGFGGQGIDAVGDITAAEIESIEILKDASAAAIYGSRASNGVILITTKKGIVGRPEITFGAYYGTQKDWRRLDLLNAEQFNEIYNEGCMNRYGANCITYTDEPNAPSPIPASVAGNMKAVRGADTDWQHEVLRVAPIATMEASVRGGIDRVRYYVSGSMLDQEGTQADLGYQKLNARVNLDYVPADRLTLGTNIALARSVSQRASNDNTIIGGIATAIAMAPNIPVRHPDGTYYTGFYFNPVGNIEMRRAQDRSVRILSNVFANYALLEGVNVRAAAGLDHYNLRGTRYNSPEYGSAQATGGAGTDASEYDTKVTYEGTLNFNRMLAAQHELSGVVGSSYEDNTESGSTLNGSQFPNEFFKYLTSATITSGSSSRADWGLLSYFGRVSYTWREKVTTTLNVRRDGSSRFGANNRYGTFPSASINWRIGEESFLQSQNIIANLSLRASYGITGNQQGLGNFQSRALFNGGANYMDQPGISPAQLANADLRWEKTKQMNFGTDFSVLDNRLKFAIDYYEKTTEDLLSTQPLPRSSGFSGITSNVGSMENRGVDLGITADWLRARGDGLNFSSSLSLSRNRNKVLSLYNNQNQYGTNSVIVGQPLGVFYGYVADGIFQTQEEVNAHARQTVNSNPRLATAPGDIRWKDINADGVINADDRAVIGNPWPDYEGGLTNNLSYKGVDVTAFIQFSQGNEIFNGIRTYMDRYGSDGDNHTTRAMQRWRPGFTNTTEPRAIWGDPNGNSRTSSRFIEDGSYWRLKNLVLGYRLPEKLANFAQARTARVYIQAQNLITRTDYSGYDPEVNSSGNSSTTRGWDFYALPQPRTITFGFNVGF
jgi:TonB-linked SusC/RagA family outer membrane protein